MIVEENETLCLTIDRQNLTEPLSYNDPYINIKVTIVDNDNSKHIILGMYVCTYIHHNFMNTA